MKKETINTFEGGMIKDLHPLTTPNNILTDALNATFITYNGNESILLNDMGNTLLLYAQLPAGYVPVGMKEHGGIIYVAAYNPKTNKGLIGSFPSPQQLWESEGWSVNAPDKNIADVDVHTIDFYEGNKIKNEVVKYKLFCNNSGVPRVFHPGDKFIIKANVSGLTSSVEAGYLSILLGVVKSDGSILIMRTWSKENNDKSFLYLENLEASVALTKKDHCLVFDASSSGEMLLIITLHTLDSFNVIRKYSLDSNKKIQVDFTGEATKDGITYNSTININDFLLVKGSNGSPTGTITEKSLRAYDSDLSLGSTDIDIYPAVPFGIINRMKKSIKIDFNKIRKNKDDFSEWRFFVTDTYVKIGWAYDFYNLDGDKEIEYIKMYFHKLEDGYKRSKAKVYEFQKEYYSGNFEDYISISDTGLKYRTVYIVEIVKKLKGPNTEEEIICFKMLYLSKLYNNMYNTFFTNTSIGVNGSLSTSSLNTNNMLEYSCADDMTIGVSINAEMETKLTSAKAQLKLPGSNTFNEEVSLDELSTINYIKDIDLNGLSSILSGDGNKLFITKVNNEYSCDVKLTGNITDVNSEIIGVPGKIKTTDKDIDIVEYILDHTSVAENGQTASILNSEWNKSTESYAPPTLNNTSTNTIVSGLHPPVYNNTKTTKFIVKDDRFIVGGMSELQTASYDTKGLVPIYSPDYNPDRKNKVAPYWKQEQMQCIAGEGDDRKTMHYNSTVLNNGTIIEGPDAGGGCDDGGLWTAATYMNNPMTCLFTGIRGENAELEFERLKKHLVNGQMNPGNSLNLTDDDSDFSLNGNCIVDQGDDYMIACWKFTDGNLGFVNLITRRDGTKEVNGEKVLKNAKDTWPRVDVMLRCILSQLFVVDKITKSTTYITPNPLFYALQKATTKCSYTFVYNPGTVTFTDVMCSSEDDTKTLTSYLLDKWHFSNEKITVNNKQYDLKNLIPKVSVSLPFNNENKISFDFDVPDLYDLDPILGNYLGISYVLKDNEGKDNEGNDLDVKNIYSVDTSKTTENTLACANEEGLKPLLDGAFKWKTTPKYKVVSGDLSIYKWNDLSVLTFASFGSYFTTRAKLEGWTDVTDDTNEILALMKDETNGYWTDGGTKESAPNMHYKTLYNSSLSLYNNSLLPNI